MKPSYLCDDHRQWLEQNPEQAPWVCQNASETGWRHYRNRDWKAALPHLGCAHDTAAIVLNQPTQGALKAVEWFFYALTGLSHNLQKMNRLNECSLVLEQGILRLRQAAHTHREIQTEIHLQIACLEFEKERLSPDRNQNRNSSPALKLNQHKRDTTVSRRHSARVLAITAFSRPHFRP